MKFIQYLFLLPLMIACQANNSSEFAALGTVSTSSLCQEKPDDFICNPFGGGAVSSNPRQGLIGNIYEGQPEWGNIEKYLQDGVVHPQTIYFSHFEVAPRSFSEGFGNGEEALKSQSNEKLIEWFSIEARGNINLPADMEEGTYHIATLSDDGIRVTVNGEVILQNNAVHAPIIDCASKLVTLKKGQAQSFKLNYFQGPRYQIALMTFIKKIDNPSTFLTESCRKSDHNLLLAEGYKVMGAEFFTIPNEFVLPTNKR